MGWFSWGKKDETPALPAPAKKAVDEKLTSIRRAAHGDFCRTRDFLLLGDETLGVRWLEAHQDAGGWTLLLVELRDNHSIPDQPGDRQIQNQKNARKGLTFGTVVAEMALFENDGMDMTPVGRSVEDMGLEHYKPFAEREGTVIFDIFGKPWAVENGAVPESASFFRDDVLRLAEQRREREQGGNRDVKAWAGGFLSTLFSASAKGRSFDQVMTDLTMRGHMEDFVDSIAAAKESLLSLSSWFDDTERKQKISGWVERARVDAYRSALPEKIRDIGLSPQDILNSEAFRKAASGAPVSYLPFIDALNGLADKETGGIEAEFKKNTSSARSAARKIQELSDLTQAHGEAGPDTEDLGKFVTALELVYRVGKAKAHYEFIRHVRGDVTPHMGALASDIAEAENLYRALGADDEDVRKVRAEVISGARGLPPLSFVDEFVSAYAEKARTLAPENAAPEDQQLSLAMEGGQSGIAPYKIEVNVDDLLQKIRTEKGEKAMRDLRLKLDDYFKAEQNKADRALLSLRPASFAPAPTSSGR